MTGKRKRDDGKTRRFLPQRHRRKKESEQRKHEEKPSFFQPPAKGGKTRGPLRCPLVRGSNSVSVALYVGYNPNQYRHLIRKMFSPSSVKLLPKRLSGRNSRSASLTESKAASRDWDQTRNSVLPGWNSQRRTAFPRKDRRWKSRFSFSG